MDRRFLLLPLIALSLTHLQAVRGQPLDGSRPVAEGGPRRIVSPHTIIEPGPVLDATLYADGTQKEFETLIVTRPFCGSDLSKVDAKLLREMADQNQAFFAEPPVLPPANAQRATNVDIIFNVINPPSGFQAAIDDVELYIESIFADNIIVQIRINFASLGGNTLGQTGSEIIFPVAYATLRSGLVNGMDTDDSIQNHLPLGSSIPVRYDGNTSTVTNETQLIVNRATFGATIGSAPGNTATMTINTDFTWDLDPSNGVPTGMTDFQSVLVHEIGHALGFTSGIGFGFGNMTILDVYRFQRTDGTGDFNPDTLAEFSTKARLVDFNTPNNDHNSDLISVEYAMSDGSPRQASHFQEQNPPIGIMGPTIASGITFFPDFFRDSDMDMFDAIGWDVTSIPDDLIIPSPDPMQWEAGGEPAAISSSQITMTAALATDPQNASGSQNSVEYCLTGVSGGDPTAGTEVGSACWQAARTFTDTGLAANTVYSYDVRARDTAVPPNETLSSSPALSGTTFIQSPTTFFFGVPTDTSFTVSPFNPNGDFTNLTVGSSGIFYEVTPPGGVNANVWLQVQFVDITGLTPGTEYTVRIKARNQFGMETPFTFTQATTTTGGCTLVGDVNQDGLINGADIDGFLRAKLMQAAAIGEEQLCADFGNAGDLALDTADFVSALLVN